MSKFVMPPEGALVTMEDPNLPAPKLGKDQQALMDLLQSGKTLQETAQTVGISRSTFYHWLKTDLAFRAVYNQWQNETQETVHARLLALSGKALDTLEKAIEEGDVQAALQLLRLLGRGAVAKLTNVEDLREWSDLQRQTKKISLLHAKNKLKKEEALAQQI